MPTLAETDVNFDDGDVKLLTEDCDLDRNCSDRKKASVEKYHRKMQAIQCIHGLFVLKVLDELFEVEPLPRHRYYLKNMLALLAVTQWDPYPWQVEAFTFVEGFAASDPNSGVFREYFRLNDERMREKPLALVSRCVQDKYLPCRGDEDTTTAISGLVEGVYPRMVLLYRNVQLHLARNLELYTVKNLMLWDLYERQECFFSWSYDYRLDTFNVERQLLVHAKGNAERHLNDQWVLDPIGGNKYNDLISKCIHLRLVHFVWIHLNIYHTVKSRQTNSVVHSSLLRQMWNKLVPSLKTLLSLYRFKENIYWSAIHLMMDDLANVSTAVLEEREKYTRNYFCRAVEDLGLADASDMDRQLREVKVWEHPADVYAELNDNYETLIYYITTIKYTILPLDYSFVRMIVSAEGNDNFFKH